MEEGDQFVTMFKHNVKGRTQFGDTVVKGAITATEYGTAG